jgi:hypothetical protein
MEYKNVIQHIQALFHQHPTKLDAEGGLKAADIAGV